MSIWTYTPSERVQRVRLLVDKDHCPYCHADAPRLQGSYFVKRNAYVCPTCGWWKAIKETGSPPGTSAWGRIYGAAGTLKDLNLTDISTPVEEARRYLLAKYESRFSVHPRLFEETVASVFKDLGYSVRVTGYSKDDGIDVILEKASDVVGVQVKRYKNSIKVEQVRSLVGALVLAGMTKGVFVTTSGFQSGASRTASRYESQGYAVELYDAERFYDALKIAQRPMYDSIGEFLRVHSDVAFHWIADLVDY
jgi:restriction system protein